MDKVNIRKKTSVFVYFFIFIYMLMQMRCWIGFSGIAFNMQFFLIVILALSPLFGLVRYQFKNNYVIFSCLYFLFLYITGSGWSRNLNGQISMIVPALLVLFVLSIPDEDKNDFLKYIIKWFGFILIPSIALYLVSLQVSLPSLGTLPADYGSKVLDNRYYLNYFFYIKPVFDVGSGILNRFNGPFLESGDVGCVGAFILFASQFDFKKYKGLWVVLVSVIISFSLAGWLLSVLAFIMVKYSNRQLAGRSFFWFVLALIVFYIFGITYNGGNNVINELILSRLTSDDELIIVGNNRINVFLLEYFYNMFQDPRLALFGYDEITQESLFDNSSAVGFVPQAIRYGMIGIILLLLPYLSMTLSSKSKRLGWSLFFFIIIYFFQRTEMFWLIIVVCYVYVTVINDKNKNLSI